MQNIIDNMNGKAVLVVGDLMLDRFVMGAVARISPEAPVPVLKPAREQVMLGGAGNVLANLAGLGVAAHVIALIGADAAGKEVTALAARMGVATEGLLVEAGRPTAVKTRFMSGPHHLLRVDEEVTGPVSADLAAQTIARATDLLGQVQALVLSDYGKGVLTPAVISALIKAAQERGVPVLVDPKGADYSRYRGADAVTPNRAELAEAAGSGPLVENEAIVEAARAVMEKAGIKAVVATRSEDGMSVIRAARAEVLHIPTVKLPVFDVAGAGDTVIAVLAAALAAGAGLEQAAMLANRAAGIVVAKPGTAAIMHDELGGMAQGIMRRDEAARQVALWQAQGLRVGFTNGCFDILHFGHVSYLREARSRCDRLVVAVNSDESVRRLKGPARPVNDVAARGAVLAALQAVDMVVAFGDEAADEDKPCALLERLRPDVIFKGGDYKEEQLPEAKIVRAYGGDVQIMSMFEGHSTTATIARMKS